MISAGTCATPHARSPVGDFRGVLYTALGAVALLLLIACCNVANMLLARATVREREMTIRAALGAGRGRIMRQVLVESVLLALAGAAGGCLLAYLGIGALVPLLPQGPLPGEVEFGLDRPALLFSLGVAVASALLFGLAPALYSARRDLVEGLKADGRGFAGAQHRVRHALIVAGIALSLVLVLGAGLLMRSFVALVRVDLGFHPGSILVTTSCSLRRRTPRPLTRLSCTLALWNALPRYPASRARRRAWASRRSVEALRSVNRPLVDLLLAHGADPNAHVEASGNAVFAAARYPEIRASPAATACPRSSLVPVG